MRTKLMPKFAPVYADDSSELPDKIRISTVEGKVLDYVPAVPKQHKSVLASMLDRFTETCYGGEKKERKP